MAKKAAAKKPNQPGRKPKGVANKKGKSKASQPWLTWKSAAQGKTGLAKLLKAHEKAKGSAKGSLTKGIAEAKRAIKNLAAKEYRARLKTVNEEGGETKKRGPKDTKGDDKSSEKGKKTEKTSKVKRKTGRFKQRSRKGK